MSTVSFPRPIAMAAATFGSRTAAMMHRIVDLATVLSAAVRVSRALESRHEPARADLAVLGVSGSLPGVDRL